jgi:hypothetical protein
MVKNPGSRAQQRRQAEFPALLLLWLLLSFPRPSAAQAPCDGVPPYPCARTDINFQDYRPDPLHLSAVGNTGVPFINDFGEPMVRVTDANTEAPYAWWLRYDSFAPNSSAERNVWSKFDSALFGGGGYRVSVQSSGGLTLVFALDAQTLRLARLDGAPGAFPHGFTNGFNTLGGLNLCNASAGQSDCNWSYVSPTVVYAVNHTTRISKYDFARDAAGIQTVYDTAGCPGLPQVPGLYAQDLSQSADDTKFSFFRGGSGQGQATLVVYYDASLGECYWYDTRTGRTGGTGMAAAPVLEGVGILPPPAAPAVIALPTGGRLTGPATYCVQLTLATQMSPSNGETTAGGETCASMPPTATGSLRIVFPPYPNPSKLLAPPGALRCTANLSGCRPFNLYIGIGSGNEVLQRREVGDGYLSYTQTEPLAGGPAPPRTNTAGYNVHNAQITRDGSSVRINYQQGYSVFWWQPGTSTVLACTSGTCFGHMANGYAVWTNQALSDAGLGMLLQPTDFFREPLKLVPVVPGYYAPQDVHISWNNDDPTDSAPIIAAYYNSRARGGNGSLNGDSNPAVKIRSAWNQEILGIAADGSGTVWRFGHVRAAPLLNPYGGVSFSMQPIGQVSQDGRYFIFGSNWLWRLGTYRRGNPPCPKHGSRCRTDAFIIHLQ